MGDSVLVSLATLVLHASALLALTTALVTELAVPTGTLPTTGQLLRLPRSNPTIQETGSLSCSRKPTSLPTMTHGTLTCTTVASAMRATVVQVALWWSAPRRMIPLMTSEQRLQPSVRSGFKWPQGLRLLRCYVWSRLLWPWY